MTSEDTLNVCKADARALELLLCVQSLEHAEEFVIPLNTVMRGRELIGYVLASLAKTCSFLRARIGKLGTFVHAMQTPAMPLNGCVPVLSPV